MKGRERKVREIQEGGHFKREERRWERGGLKERKSWR